MKKCVALGAVAAAMISGSAMAEEKATSVEFELGVYSHDIWRGIVRDENPVLQGSVKIENNGFFAEAWFNHALNESSDKTGEAELNLADYTLGYENTLGVVDYSFGATLFTDPNNSEEDSTYELFATAELNNIPVVTPYFEVHHDINEVNGWYFFGGLESDFDISDATVLTVGVSTGYGCNDYNEHWYGENTSRLLDGTLYAKATYAVSENVSLNGIISYTELLDNANDAGKNDDQVFMGGGSVALQF